MKSLVKTLRELWKDPMGRIGMTGVLLLVLMALLAPVIAPYAYDTIGKRFQAPSAAHIFGTDEFGRDIFSRIIYGSRLSLVVGFISVGIALLLGSILGQRDRHEAVGAERQMVAVLLDAPDRDDRHAAARLNRLGGIFPRLVLKPAAHHVLLKGLPAAPAGYGGKKTVTCSENSNFAEYFL